MATINTFVLLTAKHMSTTIWRKRTVAISCQQWVSKPATVLSCKHFAYLVCLLIALFTLIALAVWCFCFLFTKCTNSIGPNTETC